MALVVANSDFIGTWSLLSCEARSTSGQVERAYGNNPFGRLMYGTDQRMSVLIFDPENRDRRSDLSIDPDELNGFLAYCGSFEITVEEGKIVHRVEGSNILSWIGTEQERYFELTGDQLSIRTTPYERKGQQWVATLDWVRL